MPSTPVAGEGASFGPGPSRLRRPEPAGAVSAHPGDGPSRFRPPGGWAVLKAPYHDQHAPLGRVVASCAGFRAARLVRPPTGRRPMPRQTARKCRRRSARPPRSTRSVARPVRQRATRARPANPAGCSGYRAYQTTDDSPLALALGLERHKLASNVRQIECDMQRFALDAHPQHFVMNGRLKHGLRFTAVARRTSTS